MSTRSGPVRWPRPISTFSTRPWRRPSSPSISTGPLDAGGQGGSGEAAEIASRHHRRGLRRLDEGAEGPFRRRGRVRRDPESEPLIMAAGATLATATRAASRPLLPAPERRPGFPLAFGYAVTYLGLIVLLLAALVWRASAVGLDGLWAIATEEGRGGFPAYRSASPSRRRPSTPPSSALVMLTRYRFGRKPSMRPSICTPTPCRPPPPASRSPLYAPNGWVGRVVPFKIAFTPYGIPIALVFVGLPFCVRNAWKPSWPRSTRNSRKAPRRFGASRTRAAGRRARPRSGNSHRVRACLRARGRRIRLGDLRRRQHSLRLGDRAPPHHQCSRSSTIRAPPPSRPSCWRFRS